MLCTLQETGDVEGLSPSTLRTVTLWQTWHWVPTKSLASAVGSHMLVLGSKLTSTALGFCWHSGSCLQWQYGEGSALRWGGLPTSAGVVLAHVLVDLVVGVVFTVFGVCSHLCSCLLAIDGQMLGTHGIGWCVKVVFTAFTVFCDAHLGNVVVASC